MPTVTAWYGRIPSDKVGSSTKEGRLVVLPVPCAGSGARGPEPEAASGLQPSRQTVRPGPVRTPELPVAGFNTTMRGNGNDLLDKAEAMRLLDVLPTADDPLAADDTG
jgi:hypothetical protein